MKTCEDIIRDSIGNGELADYLTAPSSWRLGVYEGGKVVVGDSVGSEIDPDEFPITSITCPGIGNVDVSWFAEGMDGTDDMDPEDIIREACENGDVSDEIESLVSRLIDACERWGDR